MSRVLERARYPLRRSKYSNRVYNDRQHVILLVLRQYHSESYRDFYDRMEVSTSLLEELGLSRMPHFTTLHKFAVRTETRRLERLLKRFLDQVEVDSIVIAVDSTGYSCTSASHYYTGTIERRMGIGKRSRKRAVRRHIKQTLAIDVQSHLILAMKLRMGPTNDSPDLVRVMKKLESIPIEAVLADKGYDSELNREYIKERGADVHIPVRAADRPSIRIRGRLRRRQMEEFDEDLYHRRVLVESVFSSIKRGMRNDVLSRKTGMRHRELVLRGIAYNCKRLERLLLLLICGGFLLSRSKPWRTSDITERYGEAQRKSIIIGRAYPTPGQENAGPFRKGGHQPQDLDHPEMQPEMLLLP